MRQALLICNTGAHSDRFHWRRLRHRLHNICAAQQVLQVEMMTVMDLSHDWNSCFRSVNRCKVKTSHVITIMKGEFSHNRFDSYWRWYNGVVASLTIDLTVPINFSRVPGKTFLYQGFRTAEMLKPHICFFQSFTDCQNIPCPVSAFTSKYVS